MRAWLKKQLKVVDEYVEFDEFDEQQGDELRAIVVETGRRASHAGLPDCLTACSIRPGPISPAIARKVLAKCLAAIKDEQSPWLTVKQAAEHSGLSTKTIYGLCASGKLPHSRVGRTIKINRADLERASAVENHSSVAELEKCFR